MNRSDQEYSRFASHVGDSVSPFPGDVRPPPLKKQCVTDSDRTPTFAAGRTNSGSRPSSAETSNLNSKWAEFDHSFQPQSSESAMYHSYMGLNMGIDAAATHQELFIPVHPGQVHEPSPYQSAGSVGSNSDDNGIVGNPRISPVPHAAASTDLHATQAQQHVPAATGGVSPTTSFAYSEQYKSIPTAVSDDSGCSTDMNAPVGSNLYGEAAVKQEEADTEPYKSESIRSDSAKQDAGVSTKADPEEAYINAVSKSEPVEPLMSADERPAWSAHPYMDMHGNPATMQPYISVVGQVDPYVTATNHTEQADDSDEKQKKWVRWSEAEDEVLRTAVTTESDPPNWKLISKKYFGGERNEIQCKNRWKKSLQPGLIKGAWTKEEDAVIRDCVNGGVKKWSDIAKRLPGRIGDQVKERWHNSLDPLVKKGMWTEDEIRILHEKQRELGNQWSRIADFIPGRSENSVKNRWYNEKTSRKRAIKRQLAAAATATQLAHAPAAIAMQPIQLSGEAAENQQAHQQALLAAATSAIEQSQLAASATATQQV